MKFIRRSNVSVKCTEYDETCNKREANPNIAPSQMGLAVHADIDENVSTQIESSECFELVCRESSKT